MIRSGSLLTFRVEWSCYVYWAHGESQGGAWIKVLSPMERGLGVVSLVQGPRPNSLRALSCTFLQDQVPRPNDPGINPLYSRKSSKFEKYANFKVYLIYCTTHVITKMRCSAVIVLTNVTVKIRCDAIMSE